MRHTSANIFPVTAVFDLVFYVMTVHDHGAFAGTILLMSGNVFTACFVMRYPYLLRAGASFVPRTGVLPGAVALNGSLPDLAAGIPVYTRNPAYNVNAAAGDHA